MTLALNKMPTPGFDIKARTAKHGSRVQASKEGARYESGPDNGLRIAFQATAERPYRSKEPELLHHMPVELGERHGAWPAQLERNDAFPCPTFHLYYIYFYYILESAALGHRVLPYFECLPRLDQPLFEFT